MFCEKKFKYRGKIFSIYGDLASGMMWVSLPVVAIFTLGWERTAVSRRTQTLLKRGMFKNQQFIRHRRAIIGNFKGQNYNCISFKPGMEALISEARQRDLRVYSDAVNFFNNAFATVSAMMRAPVDQAEARNTARSPVGAGNSASNLPQPPGLPSAPASPVRTLSLSRSSSQTRPLPAPMPSIQLPPLPEATAPAFAPAHAVVVPAPTQTQRPRSKSRSPKIAVKQVPLQPAVPALQAFVALKQEQPRFVEPSFSYAPDSDVLRFNHAVINTAAHSHLPIALPCAAPAFAPVPVPVASQFTIGTGAVTAHQLSPLRAPDVFRTFDFAQTKPATAINADTQPQPLQPSHAPSAPACVSNPFANSGALAASSCVSTDSAKDSEKEDDTFVRSLLSLGMDVDSHSTSLTSALNGVDF